MDKAGYAHDLDRDADRGRRTTAGIAARIDGAALRYLIALPATLLGEAQYLHVFDDDEMEWSPDPRRALRFATKHEAERFGRDRLLTDFHAEEWAAADLAPLDPEEDADDDVG